MKTLSDVRVDDYQISLVKLTGKAIKDIYGYLSTEFDEPIFKMTRVVLEDDSYFFTEGEHDCPYLTSGGITNGAEFDDEELQAIYDEENPDEDEEDEE